MSHIVLLGDSIFDNGAYVGGGPDVISQLKAILPQGWEATLLARDGSTTHDVAEQISRLPKAATHLIVSAGGNDALSQIEILQQPAASVATALGSLADVRARFCADYCRMLKALLACKKPLAVCTIYDPRFADPLMQRLATTALNLFNDCILREAITRGTAVLDLRLVCDERTDYANEIEPAVPGGHKIAAAILKLVQAHDFSQGYATVYR